MHSHFAVVTSKCIKQKSVVHCNSVLKEVGDELTFLLQDCWVSIIEDNNHTDASSCRSSLRLKLFRTNSCTNSYNAQEVIYTFFHFRTC
jgi:hypothetical protein